MPSQSSYFGDYGGRGSGAHEGCDWRTEWPEGQCPQVTAAAMHCPSLQAERVGATAKVARPAAGWLPRELRGQQEQRVPQGERGSRLVCRQASPPTGSTSWAGTVLCSLSPKEPHSVLSGGARGLARSLAWPSMRTFGSGCVNSPSIPNHVITVSFCPGPFCASLFLALLPH